MRNLILTFIIFICTAAMGLAQENASVPKKDEGLEANTAGTKKEYNTKRYTVKEETDIVKRALDVFKRKSKSSSLYKRRFWIYETLNEDNESYLSFMTNDQNAGIVFSPDEDFVYYVEISPDGRHRLRGFNVESQKRFPVNEDIDRFYIETCEDAGASYLVVLDSEEAGGYSVYDLDGESVVLPDMPADVNDLKNVICY
ncbi:MAG: hypothetical protein JW847_07575 [Candidatus Omnitrophica bacterium]|nr:hypothetical protein [Candidatus Omnitrophota bacterium]